MLARLTVAGESRRVDRFLRDELGAGFGRRAVAALIAAGAVRVNGRVAAKSTLVAAGDEVTVDARPEASTTLQSLPLSLAIVHCDEQLVAVDKPPGLPSTAGRGGAASVAAGLLHRFPEMAAIDSTRAAGLVHRLDTGTSGLLLAARTPLRWRTATGTPECVIVAGWLASDSVPPRLTASFISLSALRNRNAAG